MGGVSGGDDGDLEVVGDVSVGGVKAMGTVQVAAETRGLQLVVGIKFEVVTVGVAICSGVVPVLVRVMIWVVAVGVGALLKMMAVGLSARPGSGLA